MQHTQKTASGIFLPTSATEQPLPEATVIAVGPGARDKKGNAIPVSVQPGDRVLLPGWGGNAIKVGEDVRTVLHVVAMCLLTRRDSTVGILPVQGL